MQSNAVVAHRVAHLILKIIASHFVPSNVMADTGNKDKETMFYAKNVHKDQ